MSDLHSQMLEEICGIINGEVPREGLCTTADGVRFLRDRYRELREVKLELREVKRERDEAREALKDWENAAAHVEADHPDERHCGCVPVLRKLLTDARQELSEERESIVGWENKWRCAVEIAARAEVERDEAREERDIARLEAEEISQELANARKQIEGLNNFANERYEEIQKVRKERDEAREAAAKWEAIALREASINGSRIFGEEDAK